MNDTQELIDKLTVAISYKFKEDGTSPNLTISKLRHGYYCSVVRYPKGSTLPKGKEIVCKAEASTLEAAVKGVAKAFLDVAKPAQDPMQDLSNMVRTIK